MGKGALHGIPPEYHISNLLMENLFEVRSWIEDSVARASH